MNRAPESTAEEILADGVAQIGVSLGEATVRALLDYLGLLATWNRTYNLTAVRDPIEMVRHHLLDSLVVLPYVRGSRVLDVGSGAGFPGMVIALTRPDLQCVLLDKNAKKTRFCLQVIAELGVHNVEVVRAHLEDYQPDSTFSTVTARAVGPLFELHSLTRDLIAPGGCLIAMKGAHVQSELDSFPASGQQPWVVPLRVPGLAMPRHLVMVDSDAAPRAGSA